MRCPGCGSANRDGAEFCRDCGQGLPGACPACGAAMEPGSRFCDACGTALRVSLAASPRLGSPVSYTPPHLVAKILAAGRQLQGERKQVTVLFCDIANSTALAEALGDEAMHGLLNRFFELVLAEVHRYEGTVNQFLGDGIMALFGAPIAHEDHARRAVHTALGIQRALAAYRDEVRRTRDIDFQVRQGLNTGLVVVGSIGSDLRMDYTAVGDTTNVAARLQQAALPGRVVISEATRRLVAGYFATEPLGELAVKGKPDGVRAWEVVAAREPRTRLEVESDRGLTPFVGRDRELHLLAESFESARAGHGRVVFVVGEPGIGKSRLLHQFRRGLGDAPMWLEGHCVSFGRSIAFHPLVDLAKRAWHIEEADGDDAIAAKIDAVVAGLDEALCPTAPYLRCLLSVDPGDPGIAAMNPQLRRSEIFDAFRGFLLRAAERRPHVVVLEDLHWMDQATEEFLRFMADSIPASRILLVLTYRSGYAHLLGERTYHARIGLSALSPDDSTEITRALLAAGDVPDELRALINRKAEGNPFFVEEVVKSLQEIGAVRRVGGRTVLTRSLGDVVVPDTIQDVIMARIDRLAEEPKRALQMAAVIGREFTRRLIERLAEVRDRTEDLLRQLKEIELIHEKSRFPELAYMFKHALTQDVAYNSLLIQRRRELHRLIGLAIEELYADRLAEHYEMLGHHFSKAEDWPRALDYLLLAAEKAAAAFAIRESLALYDEALAVTRHMPDSDDDTLLRIHRARSAHFFTLGDFVDSRTEAEHALALARRAGDRRTEARLLAEAALATQWAHDFPAGLAYAAQAVELATEVGEPSAHAGGQFVTGHIHAITARLDEAEHELAGALATSRVAGASGTEALVMTAAGLTICWRGRFEEARSLSERAVELARGHRLLIPLLRGLWVHGIVLTSRGDYDAALRVLDEGLALSRKVGDTAFLPRYLNTLGWFYLESGDPVRAIDVNREAAERAREWVHATGIEMTAFSVINLGDALMATGDLVLASDALAEAHYIVTDPTTHEWMKWRYSIKCLLSLSELSLARGEWDRARRCLDEALTIATRTDSKKHLARGWRLSAELARARRQWDDAQVACRRALAVAGELGNPPELWKAHVALGRLHTERGESHAAREAYRTAGVVVENIRSHLRDPRLRAMFEGSREVRLLADLGEG
jgi:class 3 adenylate cyclase/tetratricopeptide (TPR) repeat protein